MLTNEEIIAAKAECYRAGIFDVLDLSPKQEEALALLNDQTTKEILFGGGAGGGKSWCASEWLLWNCLSYPGTKWFVGRKHLTQVRESIVPTFRKVCQKHGIPSSWYNYNDTTVKFTFQNGSEFKGLELMQKPGDKDFDALGSTEYTGGWIEESAHVPFRAYEVLKSRIGRWRNDEFGLPAKLFITCNPSRNWLYSLFYKPALTGTLPKERVFIRALVKDNVHRESGYLEQLEGLTGELRQRLLLGNWDYVDDPLALIEYDAIQDLYENNYLRPNPERKRMVCDIALHGSDLFRIGVFYGNVLVDHVAMEKSGGKEVVSLIKSLQAKHQIRAAHILYDADGAGGFVGQRGGFVPGAIPFHGGGAPIKSDTRVKNVLESTKYQNLKAQCGYSLAEAINAGQYWAKGLTEQERETLSEELGELKRGADIGDGKLTLKKKEAIRADIGRSPDFSDLFLMHRYFELIENAKPIGRARPIHTVNF